LIGDDFTTDKYEQLCKSLREKYISATVLEYLEGLRSKKRFVVLRHDVDRFPKNALTMARLEHRMGIHATYYFRFPSTFKKEVMDDIAAMDHEIGYHYECFAKARGDIEKSIELFEKELSIVRDAGFPIKTISAHGGSATYSSTDLWRDHDFREYGILGDAHLSLLPNHNLTYFSDTGRTWSSAAAKTIPPHSPRYIRRTDDLICQLRDEHYANYYLLVHPERWASNNLQWMRSYFFDASVNAGKSLMSMANR